MPKVELIKRLGHKGVWDAIKLHPWEREQLQSRTAEKFSSASYICRLFSGIMSVVERYSLKGHQVILS